MAGDGFQRAEQALMLWLDEGNCESDKKYGAHKTKTHTSHTLEVLTTV